MNKKNSILDEYDNTQKLYERFAMDVENLLVKFLENEGVTYNATTYRLKNRESLNNKITIKNYKYKHLSEITDIAGVRVISYYADDVDRIAEIVEKEFKVDRENTIDKRKALEPDRFGYCSVHYVVEMKSERLRLQEYKIYKNMKCEIQIRTVLQHAWAEIEHDLGYKSATTIPRDIRRNFSRLAGLLELADKEFQEIRDNLNIYEKDVQEKVCEDEFMDTEIDKVLLDVLVKSDNDIIEINNMVSNFFGAMLKDDISDYQFESIIDLLKWLGISTHSQLKLLVSNYSKYAIQIAELNICVFGENSGTVTEIDRTIGFFYLCYALLLKQYKSEKDVIEYLKDNYISSLNDADLKSTARQLLEIGKIVYQNDEAMVC